MMVTSSTLQEQCREIIGHIIKDLSQPLLTFSVEGADLQLANLNDIIGSTITINGEAKGITRRDIFLYYLRAAPQLLPLLKDRPLMVKLYPDGLAAPGIARWQFENLPEFVQTCEMFSEHTNENELFILCQNLHSLLWLINHGAIEFHPWHSRISPDKSGLPTIFINSVGTLDMSVVNYPDYLVLNVNLLPMSSENGNNTHGWQDILQATKQLHNYLWRREVNAFYKTDGRGGIDVVIPIERIYTHDKVKSIAEHISRQLASIYPELYTMRWELSNRAGRVVIDWNQNMRNKSAVAAYSLVVATEMAISMPIEIKALDSLDLTTHAFEQLLEPLSANLTLDSISLPSPWKHILKNPQQLPEIFD